MLKKISLFLLLIPAFSLVKGQEISTIPKLNSEIIAYVKTVIGKKVDRGECWDLANQALTRANAAWTFPTQFGKEVKPLIDTIYPGDLIQFTKVKMKSKTGETWTFPQHTAIVYEVIKPGHYKIAQQNIDGKKKVQVDELVYQDKVSGKLEFYRPVPKE